MKRILGIDLGTNSIGWAVVEKEINYYQEKGIRTPLEQYDLKEKGVVVFPEGVKIEKGTEYSRAAERTAHRSVRRILFRRKLRKYETLKVLINNKMCPLEMDDLEKWRNYKNPITGKYENFKHFPLDPDFLSWLNTKDVKESEKEYVRTKNPYLFRAKAVKEKILPYDLGRVFYHLAQRRGYKSSRLDTSQQSVVETYAPDFNDIIDESSDYTSLIIGFQDFFEINNELVELKTIKKGINKILKENKKDYEKCKSEILKKIDPNKNLGPTQKGINDLTDSINAKGYKTLGEYFYHEKFEKGEKIRGQITAREEHYEHEFNVICETQEISEELKKELWEAIFFQRKLKSQKGLVGKCSLEPTKARCPISRPEFELFRMYSFINNIKLKTSSDESFRPLTKAERNKIIPKFQRKSKPNFSFEDIAKELTPKGVKYGDKYDEEAAYLFNYKMNTTVSGCPTIAILKNIWGEEWNTKEIKYLIVDKKGNQRNRIANYETIWHVLFSFESIEEIEKYAVEKLGLEEKKAKNFAKSNLKKEYAALSLKAIKKINLYLEQGLIYSHAVFMANMSEIIEEDIWKKEENQQAIIEAIKSIIQDIPAEQKRTRVVNNLYSRFKDEYANNDSNYKLDEEDEKEVLEQVYKEYGKRNFSKKAIEQQRYIISWVEKEYQKVLRENKMLKMPRIDEKIKSFLNDNFNISPKKLEKLYHPSDLEKFKTIRHKETQKDILGSPINGSLKNPVVMRALHQIRKLMNTLILEGKIDEDTNVHIEFARELNDANKRAAIRKYQDELEKQKQTDKLEIIGYFKDEFIPTENEILKYQLWKEQNRKCLYTDKPIGISDFLNHQNPKYDIEHTIPRSVSMDNSKENLTLCDSLFNREIKSNKIPFELTNYEDILQRIEHWKKVIVDLDKLIQSAIRGAKGAKDKDSKDKFIQKRHYLKLKQNYWKNKYNKFVIEEVTQGYKSSQLTDTRNIIKITSAYLKSYFKRVYSVKGIVVADFRKIWGIQDEFVKKDRNNHIHHCIDAITIACMSKRNYDILAKYWKAQEAKKYNYAQKIIAQHKPWKNFVEDIKKLEDEILVVHNSRNNIKSIAKKKLRKRGKIKRDNNGKIIYQQGDVARASLHRDTVYGTFLKEDKKGKNVSAYKKRVQLTDLKEKDLEKILDSTVKKIIQKAKENRVLIFSSTKENTIKETIWMNEEKGIPIHKVMVEQTIKNPIKLKKNSPVSINKNQPIEKHFVYVGNEENYGMAIYEGKDKKGVIKRENARLYAFFNIVNPSLISNHNFVSAREKAWHNIVNPSLISNHNMTLTVMVSAANIVNPSLISNHNSAALVLFV